MAGQIKDSSSTALTCDHLKHLWPHFPKGSIVNEHPVFSFEKPTLMSKHQNVFLNPVFSSPRPLSFKEIHWPKHLLSLSVHPWLIFLSLKRSCIQLCWPGVSSPLSISFLSLLPQYLLLWRLLMGKKSEHAMRETVLIACSGKKHMCISVAMAVVWITSNHFSHTKFKMVTKLTTLLFPPGK